MAEGPAGQVSLLDLRDTRGENLLLVLVGLYLAGLGLFALGGAMPDPARGFLPGVLLYLALLAVWMVRRVRYVLAVWLLVAGCLGIAIMITGWSGVAIGIFLLAWPVGLAALLLNTWSGAVVAAACSAWLLWAPARYVPPDPAWRGVTLLNVWGTVVLVGLTVRPLLTALQWSWSSYRQSRRLLEQARESRLQLKQALADLADANLQLTRLNDLAQTLRRTADEARRAKEQFAANISHELRTPLNMIIGYSEMILQGPKAHGSISPALRADLAVILRNSQHLSELIDDVLDLSQIEAGQMALVREHIGLGALVGGAVEAMQPLFESRGLYLRSEVPEGLTIHADSTRIREVLLNLLSNAGRFTERGGVQVRAWPSGGQVVISVADTGPGIAAADQAKLFQPFQQLDGSIRRRHGGTGLGLAISKAFVELHGGRMWLESREGQGTTISFSLPAEPAPPVETSALRWLEPGWEYRQRTRRSLAPRQVDRPRFVVLEDGETLQRLLRRHVGGEVVAVGSLAEAAQELERVPSRALLVNRSPMGEVLQQLGHSGLLPEGTPALVCAIAGEQEVAHALGAAAYLVKPVSRDTLLAAVGRLNVPGGTLLIVDDEPEAIRLFWRMLTLGGRRYRVLTATNGHEALGILRTQRPDCLLLDLAMPEMDGFQLLAAKNEDPDLRRIPAIVVSARDPTGQPVVAPAVGITRGGGLSVSQLLAHLEVACGGWQGWNKGKGETERNEGTGGMEGTDG
ncbi:MAG: ATP-binding protein [Anaerolineae bacterium]